MTIDFDDLLHRVMPTTSFGWFKIGLLISTGKIDESDSSSESEVATPSPCMRRNSDSFCSVLSAGSETV